MKILLLLAVCSASITSVFAKDSDWKLCKGEVTLFDEPVRIVVSSYEHRAGNGRVADMTFIYGGNILQGSLNTSEVNSGTLKLKGNNSSYKGTAAIDFEKSRLVLAGKLTLNRQVSELNALLECETL
jgi:hypothetical protein